MRSRCLCPSRSIAKELADWLIHNNVVEHIFGPNLHIEVGRLFLFEVKASGFHVI